MEVNYNFSLMPTDAVYSVCKQASKKDALNLSLVNKSLAGSMAKCFEVMVPRALKYDGCSFKRIFMSVINSESELIERMNDLSASIKPESNYNFQCSFIKTPGDGKNKDSLVLRDPSVVIEVENYYPKKSYEAQFVITNDNFIPSASYPNEVMTDGYSKINVTYFKEPPKNIFLGKFSDSQCEVFIESITEPKVRKLASEFKIFMYNKINVMVRDQLNKPDFDISKFCTQELEKMYEELTEEEKNILIQFVKSYEAKFMNLGLLDEFMQKLNFDGDFNDRYFSISNTFGLTLNILNAYTNKLIGKDFEVDQIDFLLEHIDVELFKEIIVEVVQEHKLVLRSIRKANESFKLLLTENKLYEEAPLSVRLSNYKNKKISAFNNFCEELTKEMPKIMLIGILFGETVILG